MKYKINKSNCFVYFILSLGLFAPIIQTVLRNVDISFLIFIDKIPIAIMSIYLFLKIIVARKIAKEFFLLLAFLGYGVLLIFLNDLPIEHVAQVILDSRFFVYGLFFLYVNKNGSFSKNELLSFFELIILLSVPICIIQIVFPDFYYSFFGVLHQDRGVWGINLSSFFSSRVSFAQFLVVFLIFYVCEKMDSKQKFLYLSLATFMLILTFSRKEVFFAFFFFPLICVFFYNKIKVFYKSLILIMSFIAILFLYTYTIQHSINELGEDYVRYQIFNYGLDIIQDYFPLGSGPGTFGSIFSMSYLDIYKEYNVPDRIIYGYSDFGRGPIFDMFLSSFIAEYGAGIVFFIIFFKRCFTLDSRDRKLFSGILIFFLFYSSIMTPAFSTITCLFVMASLFSLSTARDYNV
ncbi:hypothetical protein [Shewanella baltica]|uniref:hypothetical protein n=1 Tax=Shewanella baltica TaxID=62322 RepID=UPI003CFC24D6